GAGAAGGAWTGGGGPVATMEGGGSTTGGGGGTADAGGAASAADGPGGGTGISMIAVRSAPPLATPSNSNPGAAIVSSTASTTMRASPITMTSPGWSSAEVTFLSLTSS